MTTTEFPTAEISAKQSFSIGAVLKTSTGIFLRNAAPFGIVSLVCGIPYLAASYAFPPDPDAVDATQSGGSSIIWILTSSVLTAALVHGSFEALRGRRAMIGSCLAIAARTFLSVFIATILYSIALGFGLVLLIIPGIMVVVIYWVYVPAIVVERKGILECFRRSSELTRGHRWPILGVALVLTTINVLTFLGTDLAIGVLTPSASHYAVAIVDLLNMEFSAIVNAVCYYYLRAEREGVDIDEIAKVFD